MLPRRIFALVAILLCCFVLLTSCAPAVPLAAASTSTPTLKRSPTAAPPSNTTPAHFKQRLLLSGTYHPDDLVLDPAGHLVFSDVIRGTVNRLNADGTVTVLISGLAGPEGLIFLPDGTLIIAEQQTNRILELSPASTLLTVLRILPGMPSKATCRDGVDGIAFDSTTQTLIIPDSPIGNVYRMSLDGKKMVLLASHISRPVGAAVDKQGNIYVADECGGALWTITTAGKVTRLGGFGMLDDVAFDREGTLLVTDLKPSIHALIRLNLATGKREILASQGFIEPQGLVVDEHDHIYLSDDHADKIVEYIPSA